MVEVSGKLLNNLLDASRRIGLRWPDGFASVIGWPPGQWYDVAVLNEIFDQTKRLREPARALEWLGEEMAPGWHSVDPGCEADALGFLGVDAHTRRYVAQVRGTLDQTGRFVLSQLDRQRGTASVRSTTILEREVELGILHASLASNPQLLYFEATLRDDRSHIDIRFVTPFNHNTLSWERPCSPENWEHKQKTRMEARRALFMACFKDNLQEPSRDLQMAKKQLFLHERMATIGTVVAGVTHEINNPTNFAHVGAQNLQVKLLRFREFLIKLAGEDADPFVLDTIQIRLNELASQLDTVLEGTTRIRTLVRDLRSFSQLDDERKTISIAPQLRSTVNLVRTQYAHRVDIECDLAADPELECWPTQLSQVFMNLIVNACQAIERKHRADRNAARGNIAIRSSVTAQGLVLQFLDNGCGMPQAVLEHIYEPFFSTRTGEEGTGLGLSISASIVKKHGGTIRVDSQEGTGSSFTLMLPLRQLS